MPTSLPPLKALHVFEVAARQLSFSATARELCVTQGAVSKQIKQLEDYLQCALFERTPAGLALTGAARAYLPLISEALNEIRRATAQIQQTPLNANRLRLNYTPSFGNLWLIPRLESLAAELPELELLQITGDGPFQFVDNAFDMAIRCLPLARTHEHASLLVEERLVPVLHPKRLAESEIETPEDLLKHPLLVHLTRPQLWGAFLASLETSSRQTAHYRHGFNHFYLSLEAAKRGQGIALIPDFMAQDALEAGELVSPLDLRFDSGYGFYFLVPSYQSQDPLIRRFKDWLERNLGRTP